MKNEIRVIPHDEIERGVDEALEPPRIEGGQGRSAGDLAHDAAVFGVSLILAAVVIALAVFA